MSLTLTPLPNMPLIQPGDDLPGIINQSLQQAGIVLQSGDILVVTQKIVSKAEGRLVNLGTVIPSEEAQTLAQETEKDPRLVELILRESKAIVRCRPGLIIVEHRLGFICANAGIDHSNVQPSVTSKSMGNFGSLLPEEWVLLLPQAPDRSADKIRRGLETAWGVRLGVLIVDSHGRAWRTGAVGVTVGLSGLPGLVDLRGRPDLFGYNLRTTQVAASDELASAASLIMGQAAEGTPVVHVRGFPYPLREASLEELIRPKEMDLFR
ncbi:MAG: coenzyme F420-0:L-glutamate ligase [Chloroflexota bacterium]